MLRLPQTVLAATLTVACLAVAAPAAINPAFAQPREPRDPGDNDPDCVFPFCIPPGWPPGHECVVGGPNCTPERLLEEIDCSCHVHPTQQEGVEFHQDIQCHAHPDAVGVAGVCDTLPPEQRP